ATLALTRGCLPLQWHSGHGRTCRWLDPVANDPERSFPDRLKLVLLAKVLVWSAPFGQSDRCADSCVTGIVPKIFVRGSHVTAFRLSYLHCFDRKAITRKQSGAARSWYFIQRMRDRAARDDAVGKFQYKCVFSHLRICRVFFCE